MKDFLSFRRMLTPWLIQFFFWFSFIVFIIAGIRAIKAYSLFVGLLLIIIGPIIVRLWCEFVILYFRINETLTDIKNNTKK